MGTERLSSEVQSLDGSGDSGPGAEEPRAEFDYDNNRFPYSIVWQPFPLLGWILPCIGHMGIADSQGVIYDFQGPYTIMYISRPELVSLCPCPCPRLQCCPAALQPHPPPAAR